jgi:hypothetical protein
VHRKYIPIYIQQDATLRSLFISGNYSTRFGWYFHPPSGAHTTVSTASGICHTVTAICLYRGRGGTGLSVLWVAYVTHSSLKLTQQYGVFIYTKQYGVFIYTEQYGVFIYTEQYCLFIYTENYGVFIYTE